VTHRRAFHLQAASSAIVATAEHPYTQGLLGCIPTLANRSADRLPVLADFMS
jgi:ABC-type dipeptide/oligopeptide/nickel transport system ATPase component